MKLGVSYVSTASTWDFGENWQTLVLPWWEESIIPFDTGFSSLKKFLTTATLVTFPSNEKLSSHATDASQKNIGAVLPQF